MDNDISVTDLIIEREQQRYLAMLNGDLITFRHLCHPELVYIHSNGVEDSLDSYLNKCRNGIYLYHRIDHQVHEVRTSGDTALAFGQMAADITSYGKAKSIHNRTLTVWRKCRDEWRLFVYQPTPIATPSAH